MHGPINVKSPNNISEWQMGFNSAFKGLIYKIFYNEFTTMSQERVIIERENINKCMKHPEYRSLF